MLQCAHAHATTHTHTHTCNITPNPKFKFLSSQPQPLAPKLTKSSLDIPKQEEVIAQVRTLQESQSEMEQHVAFVRSQVQHLIYCTNSGHKPATVSAASTDATAFTRIPSMPVPDFVHKPDADAGVCLCVCVCVFCVCVYVCMCVCVCVCVCFVCVYVYAG